MSTLKVIMGIATSTTSVGIICMKLNSPPGSGAGAGSELIGTGSAIADSLFFSVEAAAEQDCADDDRGGADDGWNRMLSRLVGLDLQIAQLHYVFVLVSAEFRDCKPEQTEQDQDRADDYDWLHFFNPRLCGAKERSRTVPRS